MQVYTVHTTLLPYKGGILPSEVLRDQISRRATAALERLRGVAPGTAGRLTLSMVRISLRTCKSVSLQPAEHSLGFVMVY